MVKVSSSARSALVDSSSFSSVGRFDGVRSCKSSGPGDDVEDRCENMNHVNPAKREDEMKNKDVNNVNAMIR